MCSCTVTQTDINKTGMFDDDINKLLVAYDKIRPGQKGSEIQALGFNFEAKNVKQMPGPKAMVALFGPNVFQSALMDHSRLDKLLEELNHYKLVQIPFRDIVSIKDRFYFSRKESTRAGQDLVIRLVFRDDALVYRDKEYHKIDEKLSDYAFAEGFLEIMQKLESVGSAASGIKDLIDTFKK